MKIMRVYLVNVRVVVSVASIPELPIVSPWHGDCLSRSMSRSNEVLAKRTKAKQEESVMYIGGGIVTVLLIIILLIILL